MFVSQIIKSQFNVTMSDVEADTFVALAAEVGIRPNALMHTIISNGIAAFDDFDRKDDKDGEVEGITCRMVSWQPNIFE